MSHVATLMAVERYCSSMRERDEVFSIETIRRLKEFTSGLGTAVCLQNYGLAFSGLAYI